MNQNILTLIQPVAKITDIMKIIICLIILLTMSVAGTVMAQPPENNINVLDKIAAIVGDEVILASEVASQVQMIAFQSGNKPVTEDEVRELQKRVLDQLISDQLFLMEAKKDSTLTIRDSEVEIALENQMAQVIRGFPSEDAFIDALAAEGITMRDLKKRYRSEIENMLLRRTFIGRKLSTVSISRYEVEQFYELFKDSIPVQPEASKLAHILIEIKPDQSVEDSVMAMATQLRQQVLDGADFATISSQNSSGAYGANGGDLGYLATTDVVPEFSRAAFQLQVGEVSGVIRTQFGYHVIKCEGKRDEKLHLRHILLVIYPSVDDSAKAKTLVDSLLTESRSGGDFAQLAKTFSDDDDTRAVGGELGWFAAGEMFPAFIDAVSGWETPGEIRGPVVTPFGFHILKLVEFQAAKQLSLENDFDQIKGLARQDKTGKMVDELIVKIKERTYIDYRIEI